MKTILILPVLFLVLFLGGCSSFYSQDQVSKLIQQESAARQVEIDALKQQASDLQNKVNDLAQKASTPAVQSVPAVANNQTSVPAAVSNILSSEVVNDPATKGWLTFINKNLNYQFKYPKDFFHPVDSFGVKIRDCDVAKLISECRTDKSKGAPWVNKEIKEINGHQFCLETMNDVAAGSFFTIYDYVNVNGAKCGDLKLVVQTHNCDMYDGADAIKCQNNNNVVVPETLSKVESTFSFK